MRQRLIAHTILCLSKIIPSTNGGKIKKSVSPFQKRNNRLNLTGNLLKPSDVRVHLVPKIKEKECQILTGSENFLNKVLSQILLYRDYHITNAKGQNVNDHREDNRGQLKNPKISGALYKFRIQY